MKITLLKNNDELSRYVGETVLHLVEKNGKSVLGLATGSSPIGTYSYITDHYRDFGVTFREVTTFNLDEYIACSVPEQSYHFFMKNNLFDAIDINMSHTHFPDSENPGDYDRQIAEAGGIDLQLLGIGRNGHIGFNEPGTPFDSITHVINLAKSTREANERFFDGMLSAVPTQAVSMGLKTIMSAKKIILIANDSTKREAVAHLLRGKIDPAWPGTLLLGHSNSELVIISDSEPEGFALNMSNSF